MHVFQTAAKILIAEHLGPKWKLRWHHGLATFGTCYCSERLITLSKPLAREGSMREAMDTLGHEIAHGLVGDEDGGDDHGPKWRAMAKRLHVRPNADSGSYGQTLKKRAKRRRAKRN